jgi:hypothetical protein
LRLFPSFPRRPCIKQDRYGRRGKIKLFGAGRAQRAA